MNCPHLEQDHCGLASWLANTPIPTTPERCQACQLCKHPQDVNEITTAMAGIEESTAGPGTTLANIISWFVRKPEGCSCPDRINVMNAWGLERCKQEKATILGWLRESALDNGYPYSELVISALLTIVFKTYEQKNK